MDIRPLLDRLWDINQFRRRLYWNRDGMVGLVPGAVLSDIIDVYYAYETLRQRGRISELPEAACFILWDQVVDIRPESASPGSQGE